MEAQVTEAGKGPLHLAWTVHPRPEAPLLLPFQPCPTPTRESPGAVHIQA